jgi:D-apionate oxidoisomerase
MATIALMGAGGKMGLRLTDNLRRTDYVVRFVEISERGKAALTERGVTEVMPWQEAVDGADIVILALPDTRIGAVAHEIAPRLKAGTMLMILDAAAPYAGELPPRRDLSYFITHPCHPPLFNDEVTPEAKADFFGGLSAKQNIVCALMQGPEEHYALGEAVARAMYAPVMRAHRCSLKAMALLEPALSETIGATCVAFLRDALDEAVRRGVPLDAARDFMLGHLQIEIAILFGVFQGGVFSDGAKRAIAKARPKLFHDDWKRVFDDDALLESVRDITHPAA